MAAKNGICLVLDVGPSCRKVYENERSFLDLSLNCITQILQRKVFSESKDEVALITFGSDVTENPLAEEDDSSYQNIAIVKPMAMVDFDFLEMVAEIGPGRTDSDFVDALVVAAHHLNEAKERSKFSSMDIYIFSKFAGDVSTDQLEVLIAGIKNSGIQVYVIGAKVFSEDIDDEASISKKQKRRNRVVVEILNSTEGASISFAEAESHTAYFQQRKIRSVAWKVNMTIGKDFSIPVSFYLKSKRFTMKSWKKCYAEDKSARIITERSFHKMDEAQTECDIEQSVQAYRYGTTLVPFSEEDKANMTYKSGEKSFCILGFTKANSVNRSQFVGDAAHVVIAQNENSRAALSALVHALYETGMVAIGRYVYNKISMPKLGVLLPKIKPDYEYLVFIQLPYMEDIRTYTFAPLDSIKKNVPTDEQLAAVDDFITNMTLMSKNESGEATELLKPKTNPTLGLQRRYQCLLERGLHPDSQTLPEIKGELKRKFEQPKFLAEQSESAAKKLKELFPLEVVLPKVTSKTGATLFQKDDAVDGVKAEAVSADGDVSNGRMSAFVSKVVSQVGTANPVDDFMAIIKNDRSELDNACRQLQGVVLQLVMDSFGELQKRENYSKAIKCLKVLRRESIGNYVTGFNDFMYQFKDSLHSKDKADFWESLTEDKTMMLITKEESGESTVTQEEAVEFVVKKEEIKEEKVADIPPAEDMDALLDDM